MLPALDNSTVIHLSYNIAFHGLCTRFNAPPKVRNNAKVFAQQMGVDDADTQLG